MPPKKKGGKKAAQDDWDADMGETIDPIKQAEEAAKEAETADDKADGAGGGGGLLATIRGNRAKKTKKGKPTEDFVEGEDPPQTNGKGAVDGVGDGIKGADEEIIDLAAKAPEEATMDDEDVFGAPIKKGKGGKAVKAAPAVKEQAADEEADEDGEEPEEDDAAGKLKSKKEKEKEKKERQKQKKKEEAAKKKSTAAPAKEAPTPVQESAPATTTDTSAPGSKKKKVNAALALLQKQQEERKRREEEAAQAEAEERARIEEEERRLAEEEKRKEVIKAEKKRKEKEKVEQLKKEGKWKSPAQLEREKKEKARLQQMMDSGMVVAGLTEGKEEKKKPVFDKKKKNPKKAAEEAKAQQDKEEAEAQRKLEETRIAQEQAEKVKAEADAAKADAEAKKAEESDELDDWEAEAAKAEADGLKDSWDAPSDEEDERSVVKPAVNGKPVQAGAIDKDVKVMESKPTTNGAAKHAKPVESDSDSEESSEDEETTAAKQAAAKRKKEAAERREREHQQALAARSTDNLRSPICCILGHVDTGKTKLLDKIRQTNVQEGEAGGITQQIGATYFPVEALEKKTAVVNKDGAFKFNVPGLLVIDTPGHESFTNLRSRGSSLCNIAILVVDIMHGLEPQTLESMRLLRDRKTPFIVALNKIDRLYGWKKIDNNGFQESLSFQNKSVQNEFRDRLEKTKLAFAEQGFNSELYYENKSMARNVSLVPTSAHTGEGIPDMLKLLVSLTQERMTNQLMYLSEVECTVLEVKVIEGLGTTIDVVLSNGILREGDKIVLCGTDGAIVTEIRALLTPAEMKELRVKSQYVHNKEVRAALGVKIAANGLDNAIAGSRLLVVKDDDDIDDLSEDVMGDLEGLLSKISTTGRGVTVQASTLGSLEALLEFLRVSKIPVSSISIGPVHRRDVITASSMLEKAKEYAVMLCFDVKVDKEAQAYADEVGVKIFTAEIIYHLFDDFTKHMDALKAQKKEESKMLAVFPCVLNTVAVFNKTSPIVLGIDVVEGNLRVGTPIAAVKQNAVTKIKEIVSLGRVTSIERDHKAVAGGICKRGQPSVAIKIEASSQPSYGRQLEEKDVLYSQISRASIDTLKEFYRDEVEKEEWSLIVKLKPLFDVN
ncbi:eukaryotic translation initiation factor 5B [Elasticomyces elasticus]|nr:eukaryotic translation initiation factor 5B [Elasticomyces elasticus]